MASEIIDKINAGLRKLKTKRLITYGKIKREKESEKDKRERYNKNRRENYDPAKRRERRLRDKQKLEIK